MVNNIKNVQSVTIGFDSILSIDSFVKTNFKNNPLVLFFIDDYFKNKNTLSKYLNKIHNKEIYYIETKVEPTTTYVNNINDQIKNLKPDLLVGIGGGITLDVTKAISNLLTNPGKSEDYQGWNLVKNPGVFKVGIPTISGTGSESSKTCVMTNYKSGLKLGMNSDYTVFDHIILDPSLTKTVDKNQFFYTGMDTYIHCIESLSGSHRNAIGDSYSLQAIELCKKVFNSKNMMSNENRMNLMVASYFGGCAIATSFVGVIHPLSAGLSVVLGTHHCISNCITMQAVEEFYPKYFVEFWNFAYKQKINIPKGICNKLTDSEFKKLYDATIIHEKPLKNALGENYKKILTLEKTTELFKMM